MCGTNMVVSRAAVLEAGGMCEFNIAAGNVQSDPVWWQATAGATAQVEATQLID